MSFNRLCRTKANVIAHVGALRAWEGRPPVGIKLCIEGCEEIGSGALPSYPQSDPELFRADALIIADMGSIAPGIPTLTTALRGMADVTLEVRTLESGKHSGQYGGAAPDALLAVLHAIASRTTRTETWRSTDCVATSGTGRRRRRSSSVTWALCWTACH